ncbi:MAG: hypothetical protein PV340_01870 [Wolbachia sp.]|nr:hypothetical protein [Wolbachia sp.]MDD9336740.1 hypothetical protein [Wolbachia sp.]
MKTLLISDKKAEELAQKVRDGKCKEVVNIIQRRQVACICVAGVLCVASAIVVPSLSVQYLHLGYLHL